MHCYLAFIPLKQQVNKQSVVLQNAPENQELQPKAISIGYVCFFSPLSFLGSKHIKDVPVSTCLQMTKFWRL